MLLRSGLMKKSTSVVARTIPWRFKATAPNVMYSTPSLFIARMRDRILSKSMELRIVEGTGGCQFAAPFISQRLLESSGFRLFSSELFTSRSDRADGRLHGRVAYALPYQTSE